MSLPLNTVTIQIFADPSAPPSREFDGIPWYPGMTALSALITADAMLADTFTFRLVYKSFFGAFVDLIDGVDDTADQFWMLYVDGVLSDYGVSDTVLRAASPGAQIKLAWRFEAAPSTHAQFEKKLSVLGRKA